MKKIIPLLLCLTILASFVGCSGGKDSTTTSTIDRKLSYIENDSYIIYDMSYNAAIEGKSKAITSKTTGTITTYTFVDLILSCGTYMTGEVVEDVKDNIKSTTGSFTVKNNPYDITDLKVNITSDTATKLRTGSITVNGKELDINSKFVAIP